MRLELKEHEREHVLREKAKEYKENEDRAALVSAGFPAISEVFSQCSLMSRQRFLRTARCPSCEDLLAWRQALLRLATCCLNSGQPAFSHCL